MTEIENILEDIYSSPLVNKRDNNTIKVSLLKTVSQSKKFPFIGFKLPNGKLSTDKTRFYFEDLDLENENNLRSSLKRIYLFEDVVEIVKIYNEDLNLYKPIRVIKLPGKVKIIYNNYGNTILLSLSKNCSRILSIKYLYKTTDFNKPLNNRILYEDTFNRFSCYPSKKKENINFFSGSVKLNIDSEDTIAIQSIIDSLKEEIKNLIRKELHDNK